MAQPFGTWPSPLSAAAVAAQGLRLSSVVCDGEDVYWVEGRPAEGGRNVIVRRASDGRTSDVVPPGFDARTRVHEYGGTAYAVWDGHVYFSNFDDQRLYRIGVATDHGVFSAGGSARGDARTRAGPPHDNRSAVGRVDDGIDQRRGPGVRSVPDGWPAPVPITPGGAWRYADYAIDPLRRRLIAVREDHSASREGTPSAEPVNTLVGIPLDGGSAGEVLASGHDFYSTPRLSGDGRRLVWLAWRHPRMPWDGTELWGADVAVDGALENARRIAGGDSESIYQPGWSPHGLLYYVSDRDGWWKLYRADAGDGATAVIRDAPPDAEFGRPQWVFGSATWCWTDASTLVAAYTRRGRWQLSVIDVESGTWNDIAGDLEPREWIGATARHLVVVAASATDADAVVRIDLASGRRDVLRASSAGRLDREDISIPEPLEFPTGNGDTAHAFYYAPRNSRCAGPAAERPPLIVIGHGGPTTATTGTLDLRIQYWTTRGFAVVDVNYRGSSGYGRPYRERLAGRWGVVDVEDMVNVVRHLVAAGKADLRRLAIRGSSAGGYTALAAITFHPGVFSAAASYYGISDIEVLAHDTHKFESRYVDRLVGPYPEQRELYRARSPIHFVERIACPLILFQGLDDKVVPPNQSGRMAAAVTARGLPVSYLTFEGEQHGFRRAETIIRCLEAELAFYGAVFGFAPADDLPPLDIANLDVRS